MKKHILLLTTGGTIASAPSEEGNGLVPAVSGQGLADLMRPVSGLYDITVREILHLDSSNIQPDKRCPHYTCANAKTQRFWETSTAIPRLLHICSIFHQAFRL